MKKNIIKVIILLLKQVSTIAIMFLLIKGVFYSTFPIVPIALTIFLSYIILMINNEANKKALFDSFFKMLMVIAFSIFPIVIILITNYTINPNKFSMSIITYSLLISSIYSILTPSIVNLIYGKRTNAFAIFCLILTTLSVTTLMAVATLNNIILSNSNIIVLSVTAGIAIATLWHSLYEEELIYVKESSVDEAKENNLKTSIIRKSKNIGNEDDQ